MRQPVPFGKYVLLERISVGGMAEVFKAKAFGVEGFEKILAIKRILPSMAEDADFIEMFIDEAKICGQLNHANICQVFELGRVNDSHFIAMEFVWGKDVLQMQNRFRKMRQTMKPEMAAFIAAKLCEGLDYAHKKKDPTGKPLGIIHRDISPQNILVSYEGELKIIDFGIAKAASRSSKTQAGVLKGKFGYMSPEQVRGLPLDRRSDIFAIGTILYEMLTADRVFIGDSDFETLEKVRNVDVPPPSKVNPKCPPALEAIILRALKKEVEDRYQWASEMQEELQAFLMGHDPVFTAKHLSAWMREQFAAELKREQEILDEQRKVGREILSQPPPVEPPRQSPPASASGSTSMPGLGLSPVASGKPAPTDMPQGSTQIVDDLDLAAMVVPEGPEALAAQSTMIVSSANGALPSLPEQSTRILTSELAAAVAPVAVGGPPPGDLPAQSTVILDSGSGVVPIPPPGMNLRSDSAAKTLMGDVSILPIRPPAYAAPPPVVVAPQAQAQPMPMHPSTPSAGVMIGHLTPGTGRVMAPLPYAPARSTLWKDIAIGIAVAAALVGAVLGVRSFLSKGGGKGTLVVMATPPTAADVLIDNTLRGHLEAGQPLTLKDVPAGPHTVWVRGEDGTEFKSNVTLVANDVSVLPAALKPRAIAVEDKPAVAEKPTVAAEKPTAEKPTAEKPTAEKPTSEKTPSGVGTGHLQLNISGEGAQVYLDGAQLPDGAAKNPIAMRAEVAHEIRVTKPGREEVKFSITLRPGEVSSRDVELLPGYGKIKITSEPAGAEVHVNGKTVGVTPLTASDLDPGKPARVSLHLRGYSSATKYVSFDKGLEQELAVTLTAGGGSSASTKEEPAETKVAEKTEPKPKPEKEKPVAVEKTEPKPSGGGGGEGYLIANTQPWAKVIIDGKDTGKTTPIAPRSKVPLKAGKHVITFLANGKKFNFDVVIKAGEDTRLIKQLTDSGM